jgi:hypothetical protein
MHRISGKKKECVEREAITSDKKDAQSDNFPYLSVLKLVAEA